MSSKIQFTVNGLPFEVPLDIRSDTPLVTFLRNHAGLKGTKYMCKEGGCGACIVTLTRRHPNTKENVSFAINSCLTPLIACHGSAIITIEGVGNRVTGYSKVQAALAKFSGTQCGFCSPGMVMNMQSLLWSKKSVTMKDVEDSFGGNVCRCTGYRPILDAFKSLTSDAHKRLNDKLVDIEDLWKMCPKENGFVDTGTCCNKVNFPAENKLSDPAWYIPNSIEQLTDIFNSINDLNYILIAGNTARGVYKLETRSAVYINILHIPTLQEHSITNDQLILGGNMCLTEVMEVFSRVSTERPGLSHLKIVTDHLQLVANIPVRNVGTLAGNLMIKHEHPEFPSDIFLIFETLNAKIVTVSDGKEDSPMRVSEFLKKNMKKVVIKKIIIPFLSEEYSLRTFKVMPRAQNVYAYVNAGFLFKFDKHFKVTEKPNIVYGGVSSTFVHADKTETYFIGKNLLDEKIFKAGISILAQEINPHEKGFNGSASYRKKLALNLFYKYVLRLDPGKIGSVYRSGGESLCRSLSGGSQSFETNKEKWPITKPLNKIESIIQCSGEAEYTNDIPESFGQLYGALVLAEQANALITNIDPSPALALKGVIAFYTAKDIPGKNVFLAKKDELVPADEELFCSGRVLYGGQPVGIIVAKTEDQAESAARKVVITYKTGDQLALTVKDLLHQGKTSRISTYKTIQPSGTVEVGKRYHKITGEIELRPQFHFSLEPQTCVCIPMEDGLHIYSATQWITSVQESVARVLNIPENSINMEVRRLGGGFGSKITRAGLVASACALAANKLNKPVKCALDIETNMKAIGKRNGAYSKYEVAFDDTGLIKSLKVWLYDDMGCSINDPGIMIVEPGIRNCYKSSEWEIHLKTGITDTPGSSWMRGPGTIEGMATIEEIMEHIGYTLKIDPVEVRLRNIGDYPLMKNIISSILETSNYHKRKKDIELFNESNRWQKRGIAFLPMRFHIEYFFTLNAMVTIFADDGTVSLTHGGIEMGQGVNTKAVQTCAATLGIGTDKIKVKPSSIRTSPNSHLSGASITSDCVVHSTQKCCEILNERLKEIKEKMPNASWKEIIAAAHEEEINLSVSYLNKLKDGELKDYDVEATAITEVEVDILTGQYQILRADILEDAGESLNPEIDVGQIEGGYVMGLGYFLTEKIEMDPITGVTSTNNTSSYWVPGPKDIPIDFRVSLLNNSLNPKGAARSKATGEPPICLALSAFFALRNAVIAARKDINLEKWLPFCHPFSVEEICLAAKTEEKHLSF